MKWISTELNDDIACRWMTLYFFHGDCEVNINTSWASGIKMLHVVLTVRCASLQKCGSGTISIHYAAQRSWNQENNTVYTEWCTLNALVHGCPKFHTCRSHLKIVGARWVTWSKLHTADPQMLGVTMENLVFKFHIFKNHQNALITLQYNRSQSTSYQVPTPCFGTIVSSSGSLSATEVCRSNKYFRQYLPPLPSKSLKSKNVEIQIMQPHFCNTHIFTTLRT